jgi:hypothetical protein
VIVDPTTTFVLALLASLVSAASLLISVLTYLHSRQRDFPRSKLRLTCMREEGEVRVEVESIGSGTATRIESAVWLADRKGWESQGAWSIPMAPGESLSAGRFDLSGPCRAVRVSWYDAARPDKKRTVTARWKPQRDGQVSAQEPR